MHKKQLVNGKEYQTLNILDGTLKDSPYRVFSKVRLIDVIDKDERENLTSKEYSFLRTAHFDFVVCHSKGLTPEFVLEFDGPHHEFDPEQERRDVIKNRLCNNAALPLIRISDIELEEHDKVTILSYMISRFKAWQEEHESIRKEIEDYVSRISPEELERLTEGGIADPSIDATFIFDCRHPFPATKRIAERLYIKFGIVSLYLDSKHLKEASSKGRKLCCEVWASEKDYSQGLYVVWKYTYRLAKELQTQTNLKDLSEKSITPQAHILYEGEFRFRMQWTLPVVEDYDPDEPSFEYFLRTDRFPTMFQELPGVHLPDIGEHFCEYLSLRQIEKWAAQNIRLDS
jgi:very-short-patch-repair endonuclease